MSERLPSVESSAPAGVEVRRDSVDAAIDSFFGAKFCAGECAVRATIEASGLVCPAMIIERDENDGWDRTDPELDRLAKVANNTWLHCIDDVKNGGEPVILIDAKAELNS